MPRAPTAALAALLLAGALAVQASAPASATHEKGDRFVVWGRVTNLTGVGLPGLTVDATVTGASTITVQDVWSGVTDAGGNYRIEIKIYPGAASEGGDEDKELLVAVRDTSVGKASFVAASPPPPGEGPLREGWGYSRIDMELERPGPPPAAPPSRGFDSSLLVLGGTAAFAATILAVELRRQRRRHRAHRDFERRNALQNLPGVGRATEGKLRAAGVASIPQLAREEPADLAKKAGISEADARRLIQKAATFRSRRA